MQCSKLKLVFKIQTKNKRNIKEIAQNASNNILEEFFLEKGKIVLT